MSETSELLRKQFKENDELRDAGLRTPDDVIRYDDIVYGTDPVWQSLDVYRPRDAADALLPVIVSVHGGGWVYGDKELYQYYCMGLAQRGFAVVNFTYRLAPEYKYPAGLEDTNSVFCWVIRHAEEYGMDMENIFAVGDSAGGHMIALYAAICTNPEYAANYDFKAPTGFVPKAIAINCGVAEMERDSRNWTELNGGLMGDLLPKGGTDHELYLISPVHFITNQFPPTFIMTATGDFLIWEAPALAQKLMEKSVPFEFHFYGDSDHTLGHVFHCNMRSEAARICNDDECEFFRKFMF